MILNLIYPKYCIICGKYSDYLCSKCLNKVRFNYVQRCHVCYLECYSDLMHTECKELSYIDGVISLCNYNKPIRKLIRKIKYGYVFDIFNFIVKHYLRIIKFYRFSQQSIFIPVPMHDFKKRKRGFNQTEIFAQKLLKALNMQNQLKYILKRSRYTKAQVGLNKQDRLKNLKNVFSLNQDVTNKIIYLIDDVYTTGSTLNECAKLLKQNGAAKVYAIVVAANY